MVVLFLAAVPAFLLSAAPLHTADAPGGALLADKHQKAGVNCQGCHKESPPSKPVPTETCLTCHGDLAKLIARSSKAVPNPHASPHIGPGETPRCDECHHVHKPSDVSCLKCHQDFKYKIH